MSLLGTFNSPDVRTGLISLAKVHEDKLGHFPFLREDVNRALAGP